MFCPQEALVNEAAVELKFLWPLITDPAPRGLGFTSIDVFPQARIAKLFPIGKGSKKGSSAVSVGGVSRVRGATVGFFEAWLGRSMDGRMKAALAA